MGRETMGVGRVGESAIMPPKGFAAFPWAIVLRSGAARVV